MTELFENGNRMLEFRNKIGKNALTQELGWSILQYLNGPLFYLEVKFIDINAA